jgi:hypothetical protein
MRSISCVLVYVQRHREGERGKREECGERKEEGGQKDRSEKEYIIIYICAQQFSPFVGGIF